MDWHTLTQQFGPSPRGLVINVDITQQHLSLHDASHCIKTWPVSTAKNGAGNQQDSFQTPTGTHCIAEKIGDGDPACSLFVGRQNTGQIATIINDAVAADKDMISSRILWLQGLQAGINKGGDVDSHDRYIYIHGTPEEGLIGTPASHGCIRMRNADVIELFDLVDSGTLVHIQP